MDITILELKKVLKGIEEEKSRLFGKLSSADVIKYSVKDDRQLAVDLKPEFSKIGVLQAIEDINNKERKLKHALNEANRTTITSLGISIADALVHLAQNQRFVREIECSEPRTKNKLEVDYQGHYTEYLYDFDSVECVLDGLKSEITTLQLAIDVANASTVVHIED
jgi:hypothetical protein